MQLIGLFDSPYVRRVAVSLRLYGFAFEHAALSVFRQQDEMRKINPLLKVPLLVLDNGEKLIESSIILDCLEGEASLIFPCGRYPQLETLSAYCEALPAFVQTPME